MSATILEKSWGNARIQNWRVDDDGMLRVTAHILKEGVYPYGADETKSQAVLPGVDPVQQYIPASEFTDDALTSLEGKPVVINAHEWRDAENTLVDGLTVGTIAGRPTVTNDGCVECDMLIFDPDTIEKIKDRDLIEVSAGYDGNLILGDGDFGGRPFHGTQTDLRFNHVLLLPKGMGRCGYGVRIINSGEGGPPKNNVEGDRPMPTTLKVTVANKLRSYKFENEEDASKAEEMLNEEKTFNAEALQEAISSKQDLEGQMDELQKKLDGANQELTAAKDQIEKLLSPEAQEGMANELNEQKDAEDAIIDAETDNMEGEDGAPVTNEEQTEEKDAFGNALKGCKSMAERRKTAVTRVMNMRGTKVEGWTQDAFDGAFKLLAANAKVHVAKNGQQRTLNGSLDIKDKKARRTGNAMPQTNYDRLCKAIKAKNSRPEENNMAALATVIANALTNAASGR